MLANRVLRKIFGPRRNDVTEECRKLHNEELYDLHCSPHLLLVIKSRRTRWVEHVARMGESRRAYKVLVGRPERNKPPGRHRR